LKEGADEPCPLSKNQAKNQDILSWRSPNSVFTAYLQRFAFELAAVVLVEMSTLRGSHKNDLNYSGCKPL